MELYQDHFTDQPVCIGFTKGFLIVHVYTNAKQKQPRAVKKRRGQAK